MRFIFLDVSLTRSWCDLLFCVLWPYSARVTHIRSLPFISHFGKHFGITVLGQKRSLLDVVQIPESKHQMFTSPEFPPHRSFCMSIDQRCL
ncbi:hypothetical protein BC939DRAFT_435155 [Gamsiella multidivaricata]|uniref:uncharacterized protein n=1 Tax=Gamsiella multidivaricata TaxID=101098 RepID=UPI00221EA833|nr:uncharacterized protein BC939DRAFT_435155 [Gamsiella multidivaricata]KAI7832307.1 hypothetical protein BC939DRAFT_435155 [Gamsiella multidivaricata]